MTLYIIVVKPHKQNLWNSDEWILYEHHFRNNIKMAKEHLNYLMSTNNYKAGKIITIK